MKAGCENGNGNGNGKSAEAVVEAAAEIETGPEGLVVAVLTVQGCPRELETLMRGTATGADHAVGSTTIAMRTPTDELLSQSRRLDQGIVQLLRH